MQSVCRLVPLRRRLAHRRFRSLNLVFELSILRFGDFYLLIQRSQSRFRPVNVQLKVCWINFKQKIAALYELIVRDADLNDRTGNTRCNADEVGPGYCIVSPRMSIIVIPCLQAEDHRQNEYGQAEDQNEEAL